MIKINLLPLDKRKTERTPLKGAAWMLANAGALLAVAVLVVISVIQISNVKTRIKAERETLASLQPFVAKHAELKKKSEDLQRDFNDLTKVTATRPFEWSEVFDAIWDAVHKHKRVWLDSMELADGKQMDSKMKQLDPRTKITGSKYGIILKCHVGGLDVKGMTAFRQELKSNEKLARYFPVMNFDTQWSNSEQKDFSEKYALDFEIVLINTGQTKDNTAPPAPTPTRSER